MFGMLALLCLGALYNNGAGRNGTQGARAELLYTSFSSSERLRFGLNYFHVWLLVVSPSVASETTLKRSGTQHGRRGH